MRAKLNKPHTLSPLSSYLSIYAIIPGNWKSQIVSEFTIIKFIQLQFAVMVKETTKILFLRMTSPKVWKWVTSNESLSFECKINVISNLRSLHYSLFPPAVPTRLLGVSGQLPPGVSSNEHYCDDDDDDYNGHFFFLLTLLIWLFFRYIRLQARRLSIWCRGFYSATRFWFLASSKELETCRLRVWNYQSRNSGVGDREQETRSQRNKAFDWKVVQFQMCDSKRVRRRPSGAGTQRCCQRHYGLV